MKIQREGKPAIIIGKRVVLGQIVGAALTWGFWITEEFFNLQVPAAMVTQATVLVIGIAQIWAVNKFGVTTQEQDNE
jgi:hypothetical protein